MKELSQRGFKVLSLALNIILLVSTIYLCFRNYTLKNQLSRYCPNITSSITLKQDNFQKSQSNNSEVKLLTTDTKYQVIPKYSGTTLPNTILYWSSDTPMISRPSSNDDIPTANKDYIKDIVSNSLQDSLTQMILSNKTLELSFYRPSNKGYLTQTYEVDLSKYSYNWTLSEGLSYQRIRTLEILPYVYGKYKAIQKVPEIGTGISVKTSKIDYNIGFSLNQVNHTWKPDFEISVNYRLNPWLK